MCTTYREIDQKRKTLQDELIEREKQIEINKEKEKLRKKDKDTKMNGESDKMTTDTEKDEIWMGRKRQRDLSHILEDELEEKEHEKDEQTDTGRKTSYDSRKNSLHQVNTENERKMLSKKSSFENFNSKSKNDSERKLSSNSRKSSLDQNSERKLSSISRKSSLVDDDNNNDDKDENDRQLSSDSSSRKFSTDSAYSRKFSSDSRKSSTESRKISTDSSYSRKYSSDSRKMSSDSTYSRKSNEEDGGQTERENQNGVFSRKGSLKSVGSYKIAKDDELPPSTRGSTRSQKS